MNTIGFHSAFIGKFIVSITCGYKVKSRIKACKLPRRCCLKMISARERQF